MSHETESQIVSSMDGLVPAAEVMPSMAEDVLSVPADAHGMSETPSLPVQRPTATIIDTTQLAEKPIDAQAVSGTSIETPEKTAEAHPIAGITSKEPEKTREPPVPHATTEISEKPAEMIPATPQKSIEAALPAQTPSTAPSEVLDDSPGMESSSYRDDSPPPDVQPTPALEAVPQLTDRSVSTPTSSSISTISLRSRPSRLSDGGTTVVKRRGYMRPQNTAFSNSARNRDSVMSLGSIAHMQYYFARTGLLDGKGGQLAREKRSVSGDEVSEPGIATPEDLSLSVEATSNYAISDSGEPSIVESPTETMDIWDPSVPQMLPPTVSTYKQKPSYTEPLPDMPVLRRELKEALQDACKVLEESQKQTVPQEKENTDAFYELQGLHLLDITTLAIRAARNYYTSHSNHDRLYAIKSERQIRTDLYQVLEILKRMASRNFKGGIRMMELTGIVIWIESIDKLIKKEEQQEQDEAAERATWIWREGDWTGKEREREWLFLKSFETTETPLPQWPERTEEPNMPTDFLQALQDGQRLVKLHNALVARSKRRFEIIKTWHSDVGKPYRMAENLQYWQKAAELRFDLHLALPMLDVVNGKAWQAFDDAVFTWTRKVREELTEEWRQEDLASSARQQKPPEVKIESHDDTNVENVDTLKEPEQVQSRVDSGIVAQ